MLAMPLVLQRQFHSNFSSVSDKTLDNENNGCDLVILEGHHFGELSQGILGDPQGSQFTPADFTFKPWFCLVREIIHRQLLGYNQRYPATAAGLN